MPQKTPPPSPGSKPAGAIILGKTNTPDLTMAFETNNLVYGRTNNPFDIKRTPGGSSGGAGAIIAAGGSPLDIGSDTGGSIRVPSHFCGIAGIKPTAGRVSRAGHIIDFAGPAESLTHIGPLAKRMSTTWPSRSRSSPAPTTSIRMSCDAPLGEYRKSAVKNLRVGYFIELGSLKPSGRNRGRRRARTIDTREGWLQTHGNPDSRRRPDLEIYTGLIWGDGGAGMARILASWGTKESRLFDRIKCGDRVVIRGLLRPIRKIRQLAFATTARCSPISTFCFAP